MYLHIGENKIISLNKILGVFDYKTFDSENCEIVDISGGEPNSVIMELQINNSITAYISRISSHTLIKRVYEINSFYD